jgi:outer membrane protein assembly factor BamB
MASGDMVYVARGVGPQATEHDFMALSIVDGTVLWDHPSASQIYPGAVAGDLVLASSDDGTITALDPDGTPAWSDPAGDIQPLGMAVVGDTLYAPGADDTVRALVAVTGQQSWSVPVTGKPSIPVVIDGRVIVGTTFGAVQALGDAPASP